MCIVINRDLVFLLWKITEIPKIHNIWEPKVPVPQSRCFGTLLMVILAHGGGRHPLIKDGNREKSSFCFAKSQFCLLLLLVLLLLPSLQDGTKWLWGAMAVLSPRELEFCDIHRIVRTLLPSPRHLLLVYWAICSIFFSFLTVKVRKQTNENLLTLNHNCSYTFFLNRTFSCTSVSKKLTHAEYRVHRCSLHPLFPVPRKHIWVPSSSIVVLIY